MAPDALGWHAELALDASHDWNLQLGDEAGTWRLRGRLPRGHHVAHLGPALETQRTPGPTTPASTAANRFPPPLPPPPSTQRSDERRVGNECVRTGRSRRSR